MASAYDILDPFTRIQPGPFISKYSDWILFTLLLFFFWSAVGIALKKKFGESRHLRTLVTSVALILAVGTYYSVYKGWLHLSLQGFGLFGTMVLLIIIFFIIFGLMRGYGVKLSNSLSIGFVLFYIGLWAVSPNVLHNISGIFPPLNMILLVLFIVAVFKSVRAFFRHTSESPVAAAIDLGTAHFTGERDTEMDREISEDKKERRLLKHKTMKLTKLEISTVNDIETYLQQMIKLIRGKGNTMAREEVAQLTNALRHIAQKETVLRNGLELIKRHVTAYKAIHRKDIPELEKRLAESPDKKQRRLIERELRYQKNMLQALDYMNKYESKVIEFTQSFNKLLAVGMQKLKSHYPAGALSYLEHAHKGLYDMKGIYEKQKALEKYLLKVNKKTISDLKKERDPK